MAATTHYLKDYKALETAFERMYNYFVEMDKPVRISAYRNLDDSTGGVMYGYKQSGPPYEIIHHMIVMFEIDQKIFDMSAQVQQRLLDNGYLVDCHDCVNLTHRFTLRFGKHTCEYYGIMSDEDAVIQGLRHGAIEIKRIGEIMV